MKRKILFITERRADYSKLKPIIKEMEKSKVCQPYLIVTGSHLLKKYGYTINEIKKDKIEIYKKFKMFPKNSKNTPDQMTLAFGNAIIEITKIIKKLKPDMIFTGFDIGANFAGAIVGAHMNIHVAHMEGGEVTGTIDESIRHAISKFAHIHFTTNDLAKKRLIKMGENKNNIFVVGNPSLDEIQKIKKISIKELEKEFNIKLNKPLVLLLQHTVTTEFDKIDKYFLETISAIKQCNIQCLIISGNIDAGSEKILKIIQKSKIQNYSNLSFEKYINLLQNCSVLIGNSSSGIMEAPFLQIPSINIGTRQTGRLTSKSIINVGYDQKIILKAIKKTIYDKKFLKKMNKTERQYGNGDSSKKIVKILEKIDLNKISIQKRLPY
jgi:GDP/UDP-N,N'-diacetylbacillosamine 2-epimerase (hydrolysing)